MSSSTARDARAVWQSVRCPACHAIAGLACEDTDGYRQPDGPVHEARIQEYDAVLLAGEDDMSSCIGLCVTGADIGVGPLDGIAYPHPMCPEHGQPHEFKWNGKTHDTHDGRLRWCECGAYEDEHSPVLNEGKT